MAEHYSTENRNDLFQDPVWTQAAISLEERNQEFCRMANDGIEVKDIAAKFDVCHATVYLVLKANGIKPRNKVHKLTEEEKDTICQHYKDGANMYGLARTYGVSFSSVHELLVRRKIPRRKRGGVRLRKVPRHKGPRMCKACGSGPLPPRHFFCPECRRQKTCKKTRQWRRETIAKGICPSCCKPLDRKGSYCQACVDRMTAKNLECKKQCFAHYGGKCTCCGETILDFLTIDHVNNDGSKRRKAGVYGNPSQGAGLGAAMYRWLIKNDFPDSYTVLCFNCQ